MAMHPLIGLLFGSLLALLHAVDSAAQEKPPSKAPTQEELANDPDLFLQSAQKLLKWDEPAEPAKLVGPIHFVGTKGLGSFLITGSQGHVLIYSGMPGSGKLIEQSIQKLGFKPSDVKVILTGHAHIDHVGGHAYLQQATGAKIAMLREEVLLFESGGSLDFQYRHAKAFAFEPAKVDTVLRNEEKIVLGEIAITAHLTAGHTPGAATYTMEIQDGDKKWKVIFLDGMGVNPGYRLFQDPSYPGIQKAYERTFQLLESQKPDVWLAPHNEKYDLEGKLARAAKGEADVWRDPDGYKAFVVFQKKNFEAALLKEKAAR